LSKTFTVDVLCEWDFELLRKRKKDRYGTENCRHSLEKGSGSEVCVSSQLINVKTLVNCFQIRAGHISPLINAYLNVDDAEGAVVALEKMSKILKRLPGKTALMEYLIKARTSLQFC